MLRMSSKQTKIMVAAIGLIWLAGLIALLILKMIKEKNSGKSLDTSLPLIIYLSVSGVILLIGGIVYYERSLKKKQETQSAVPEETDDSQA